MSENEVATAAAPEAAAVVSRVAACVEYKGTAYRGWQRQQPGVPSVQEAVEKALSRVANHPVQIFCAGRTGEILYVGSFDEDFYDAEAEGDLGLVTFFDIFVEGGFTTTFEVF